MVNTQMVLRMHTVGRVPWRPIECRVPWMPIECRAKIECRVPWTPIECRASRAQSTRRHGGVRLPMAHEQRKRSRATAA